MGKSKFKDIGFGIQIKKVKVKLPLSDVKVIDYKIRNILEKPKKSKWQERKKR